MKKLPESFLKLADIIDSTGYKAYLIGGSSRDYLLDKEFHDIDIATSCPPDKLVELFPRGDTTFIKYGCLNLKDGEDKITITTFRKESDYSDYRHPGKVDFCSDINQDFLRRDFTINAIYITKEGKIIDLANCVDDVRYYLIRTIGNPKKRLREDPLRILRAIRFSLVLDFEIEESLSYAILQLGSLLNEIKPQKIDEEILKMIRSGVNYQNIKTELSKYNLLSGYDIKKFRG